MKYIYYWKGDVHEARVFLVRKSLLEAFECATMGTGLIVEVEDEVCKSVEHLITTVEARIKAKDYLHIEGLTNGNTTQDTPTKSGNYWGKSSGGTTRYSSANRPSFGRGRDNPRAKGVSAK